MQYRNDDDNIVTKAVIMMLIACAILVAALLTGCKTFEQHAAKHPKDAAAWCAKQYPPKDSIVVVPGADLTRQLDSLQALVDALSWVAGNNHDTVYQTVEITNDTLLIAQQQQIITLQNAIGAIRRAYKPCKDTTIYRSNTAKETQLFNDRERALQTVYDQSIQIADKDKQIASLRGVRNKMLGGYGLLGLLLMGFILYKVKLRK